MKTLLCVVTFALLTTPARAQGVGVRAGVSGDPDQFYAGVHYETEQLIDHLRFRPNVEIGTGDNVTLTAINFEFIYRVPAARTLWSVYLGGGPALNLYRVYDNTQSEGGFNVALGLSHRRGLFTEVKIGMLHSPSIKWGVGYTFH
jgi:hypothetical protein